MCRLVWVWLMCVGAVFCVFAWVDVAWLDVSRVYACVGLGWWV